jgi:O-methyltransferase
MKKMINKILRSIIIFIEKSLGLKISRVVDENQLTQVSDIPHSRIYPAATYSPWKNNETFKKVYEIAKNYTLVDEYRMFELYQLASQAAKLKGDFLEVGVWRGGSSAIIKTALSESDAAKKFYIADTFQGVVKAGSVKDTSYQGGEHADAALSDVKELFSKIDKQEPEILVGIFPDDHNELMIESLAFVHSDVDAYESTKGVIEWCLPQMEKGGMIIFDDYGFRGCEGVTRYVLVKISF